MLLMCSFILRKKPTKIGTPTVLTGSQNLLLLQQVNESLAGRAARLRLLPLSHIEMIGRAENPFAWASPSGGEDRPKLPLVEFWQLMLRGCYPELCEHPEKDAGLWQSSYIQTYLERDIRNLRQIGDLTQFQIFLRSGALRSGQLFQISDVAKYIGVSVNTAKSWLGVLEATYQIIILRPYFANINKRLVKTPKVYFLDVGTLCYLTGLRDPEHLASGPMAGAVFETFVFSEIFKRLSNQGIDPQICFWRTSSGIEVDLLIEEQGKIIPIEVKTSSTPKPAMAESILTLENDLKKKISPGYVIHPGDILLPMGKNVTSAPHSALVKLLSQF